MEKWDWKRNCQWSFSVISILHHERSYKKTEDIEIEFLKWFRLKGTFKGEALSAEGSLFGILRHFEFLIRGIYKNPKGDLCAELEVGLIWLGCEITLQQMERIIELHMPLPIWYIHFQSGSRFEGSST